MYIDVYNVEYSVYRDVGNSFHVDMKVEYYIVTNL